MVHVTSKNLKDVFQYLLATTIVVSILLLLDKVFNTVIPPANKDIALLVIGALVAKFGDVVAYFFNSTKGSADKTEIIANSTPIVSKLDTNT